MAAAAATGPPTPAAAACPPTSAAAAGMSSGSGPHMTVGEAIEFWDQYDKEQRKLRQAHRNGKWAMPRDMIAKLDMAIAVLSQAAADASPGRVLAGCAAVLFSSC